MRLLAVETSSLAGGVALLDDERLVAEYLLDVSVTHSERLMAAIDHVLGDARLDPSRSERPRRRGGSRLLHRPADRG